MKFLVFTDIHENEAQLKSLVARARKEDIDFIICLGDFSTFGRGGRHVVEMFKAVGKKLYIIPGNHEEHGDVFLQAISSYGGCVNMHQREERVEGYVFLGYGGGGFNQEDGTFRKIARNWYGEYKDEKVVLLLHGPPLGTNVDLLNNRYVGNKDYRAFIERIKPKLVLCGHLHETAGVVDTIGATKVANPGWDGMVIELK